MRPAWGDPLQQYVEAGGTLIIEDVPGWSTDLSGGSSLNEWEAPTGDRAPGTLRFASLSGILFTYHHRGAVRRVRVVSEHPLTAGLQPPGEWIEIPYAADEDNYAHLAYPVKADGCTVLIEGEHETCRYDGVSYKLRGTISGTHPLITINSVGKGTVIRQYAPNSLPATIGRERYQIFAANLAQYVRKLYNERAGQ